MATQEHLLHLHIDGGRIPDNVEDALLRFDVVVPQDQRTLLADGLHLCAATGDELSCRIEIQDPLTGQLQGWVLLPELLAGIDVAVRVAAGAASLALPVAEVQAVAEGAFFVEGWIHVPEARAEATQIIAADWRFAVRPTELSTFDAGHVDGLATQGFFGAVFDGRYIYFAPQCNDDGRHGHALRYDTHLRFDDPTAWRAHDAGSTAGLTTKGYYGAVFDGRYVYYVPRFDGETLHSRVLRLDTRADFGNDSSWAAFDAGRPISCQGAAFDGRYIYFAPGMHQEEGASGWVLRFDTLGAFESELSWVWHDVSHTDGLDCRCFDGAIYDGRHVYFVPLEGGPVARFNPTKEFDQPGAWEAFDTTLLPGFGACVGAVFDGHRIHFVPYAHDTVVCYDTSKRFADPDSWEAFAPGVVDDLDCRGYDGAAFDGRWVTFIPFWDGVSTVDGFHARILRYDTTQPFAERQAWQAADGSALAPPNPGGFNGGAFDGRFLYMAPWRRNDASGEIRSHGQVLRLDTAAPDASFQLRWMDCGHNGGLGGSVPGPAFLVNCSDGPVCAQAHAVIDAGWHHVAGCYSPEEGPAGGAELWLDGVCVARQVARGPAKAPLGEISVGQLQEGSGRLSGQVGQLRLRSGCMSAARAQMAADNLLDPEAFLQLRMGSSRNVGK
ncbi:MAG: hypothetical protein HOH74_24130 [Gemmatimonadetes bacterium]|jgi:hypothetical protein|nr:hypothetical protein [Gemmatimonadota bacterium]